MNRRTYNAYRGRKSWGRRLLIVLAVLLALALVAGIVGLLVLPNYVVYTDQGPQVVLPLFGGAGKESPSAQPSSAETVTPQVVIESLAPTPAPTPAPSMPPRRDAPQGLVSIELEELLAGTAELGSGQGAILDMTQGELTDGELSRAVLDLPYAAAYLAPAWSGESEAEKARLQEELEERCRALAELGFDEILLSAPEEGALGEVDLEGAYARVRDALDELGYQGRLSAVCRRAMFTDSALQETLLPALSANVDRVYASREDSWSGLHIYQLLNGDGMEFRGTTSDIVTVVSRAPKSANYPWAVLP